MTWPTKDYATAFDFLLDNEDVAQAKSIADTGQGVSVVLPTALPGLGIRFVGLFMLAPILVFMMTLVVFPFLVLGPLAEWGLNAFLVAGLCVALLWGLYRALRLMLKNRDLFPRRYFATLSDQGIAQHSPLWARIFGLTPAAVDWKRIKSIERREGFCIASLLTGTLRVTWLVVATKDGPALALPFHPASDGIIAQAEASIRRHLAA